MHDPVWQVWHQWWCTTKPNRQESTIKATMISQTSRIPPDQSQDNQTSSPLLYDFEYDLMSTRGHKRIFNTVTIFKSKLFIVNAVYKCDKVWMLFASVTERWTECELWTDTGNNNPFIILVGLLVVTHETVILCPSVQEDEACVNEDATKSLDWLARIVGTFSLMM